MARKWTTNWLFWDSFKGNDAAFHAWATLLVKSEDWWVWPLFRIISFPGTKRYRSIFKWQKPAFLRTLDDKEQAQNN